MLIRARWLDAFLCAGLVSVAFAWSFTASGRIDPVVLKYETNGIYTSDTWFDADIPKTVLVMTDRQASQHRVSTEHPLVSLAAWTPVAALQTLGLEIFPAVRVFLAILSALWVACLFVLLRRLGSESIDAALFTSIGIASASAMFWFAVPELFLYGSLLLIIAMCVLTVAPPPRWRRVYFIGIGVLSLSLTVTNWLLGLLGSLMMLTRRHALQVTIATFLVVSALWGMQRLVFPASEFFVGSTRPLEFLHAPSPARVAEVSSAFFITSMVMPKIRTVPKSEGPERLSVQSSRPGSGGIAGFVGAAAWCALLAAGAGWGARSRLRSDQGSLWAVISSFALSQLALFMVFGAETFLYSMTFLPMLIVIAASVSLTRFRWIGRGLAVVVLITALVNNSREFDRAIGSLEALGGATRAADGSFRGERGHSTLDAR